MKCWRSLDRGERELFSTRTWHKPALALRGLHLTHLPYSVCQPPLTTTLTSLDLSYNALKVLPVQISCLVNLQKLHVKHNRLRALPDSLRCLQGLSEIDASHNEVLHLPSCLSHLQMLQIVNLSGNLITHLTRESLCSPKLEKLFLTNNPIQNVPRSVYLAGLAALRLYFGISLHDVELKTSKNSLSTFSMVQDGRVGALVSSDDRYPHGSGILDPVPVSSSDLLKRDLTTSDYGSCSLDLTSESRNAEDLISINTDSFSCYGDRGSDSDQDFESDSEKIGGSNYYDSESDSDSDEYVSRMLPDKTLLLKYNNIVAIIPRHNRSGYKQDEFHLDVIEDLCFAPETKDREVHASQIVLLQPHGSLFYNSEPAFVHIPLGAQVDSVNQLICLCSDTEEGEAADWKPMDHTSFTYDKEENRVTIQTLHFSLFTVVIAKSYPSARKYISATHGGKVKVTEVPGVEVDFPKGSLTENIEASVKVFYGDEPYGKDTEHEKPLALATPVVMLGPHGCKFNPESAKPVTIRLPIPHCREIMYRLYKDPRTHLTIWHSDTTEGEPLAWKQMEVQYDIEVDNDGNYYLSVPLSHFSWYRALWDILSTTLYECKIGVAYLYPYIQFSMMCVAMMNHHKDSRMFGLEVICYRSDKKVPDVGNYKLRVGKTTKPKMLRPGPVVVRLESNDFEADTLHGEDPSLCKVEMDFRGREFEKQFACTFKGQPVEEGVFGKVHLAMKMAEGPDHPVFEINLTKGSEEEDTVLDNTDGWLLFATRELATMLNIANDENWRILARRLGFTKHEVKQLAYTKDPFAFMLVKYQNRGGTPDEFVQNLYAVGRELRVGSGNMDTTPLDQIGFSERFANAARLSSDEESEFSNPVAGPSGLCTPGRKRSSTDTSPGTPRQGKRRRKASADVASNSSELSGPGNPEQAYRESKTAVTTQVLWNVSGGVNQRWKYLGRTLNIPEEELLGIEHQHKDDLREASYQMLLKWKDMHPDKFKFGVLYCALCQNGMNALAQQYVTDKDT